MIWREPLVWIASADYVLDFTRPARLVMLAPPCSYREMMIAALDSVRREWIAVCTASSLTGVQAAVAGGLGGGGFALDMSEGDERDDQDRPARAPR